MEPMLTVFVGCLTTIALVIILVGNTNLKLNMLGCILFIISNFIGLFVIERPLINVIFIIVYSVMLAIDLVLYKKKSKNRANY